MARGTAHQVELLRAEVGTALQAGLEEIRNHTDSLRAELTATLAAGLSEHRDEFFEAIARGQQETSRAHQDNRSLHRQLGNLRNELSTRQSSGRASLDDGPAEAPLAAVDSPEAAGQPTEAAHPPGDDASSNSPGTNELPGAEPPASEQAAQQATEPTSPSVTGKAAESDSEETTVSETTPADDAPTAPHVLAEDQLSQIATEVAAEVAAQLVDLLRPSGPTEQDTKVDLENTEAVTPDQAVIDDLPSGLADDVSGLIPEPFLWENHVNTLLKAAAVKTVAISCHPETWDFLAAQAEGADHFSKPVNDGNEDTILSGPSTIALLNALRETAYSGVGSGNGSCTSIGTWALAVTSYERIAAVINSTRPADEQAGTDRLHQPHIVLDDRSTTNSPATN
ncbi:hypothetical protein ACFV84_23050 [Kitasatospora sp. NPDC059811]|uniref:hypothetical protein n=1 Tax=Streptomycetaceae TaxID=2062 RepID=UPI0007AFDBB7|nr:hypothetical protein [Streptomyces sp. MJM8645]